jgi:hypothetical protein
MKTLSRIRLVRAAGLAGLLATSASAAGAEASASAPIPPPRPGLVESPKGDGKQLTPLRRTTHEERLNAALRLAERRKARGAAPTPAPSK